MGLGTLLSQALKELENVSDKLLRKDGAEEAGDTILVCSIAAAASGIGSGMLPGAGSVVASIACVTAIWTMYVKINKHLGISVKDNILKSLASAILTNIIASAGSYILVLIGAVAISFIPGIGYASTIIYGTLAFISVYASGILYIKILTRVMRAKKTLDLTDVNMEDIAKDVVNESNVSDLLKEGKEVFKQTKNNGKFDKILKDYEDVKCPHCSNIIAKDSEICYVCGMSIK